MLRRLALAALLALAPSLASAQFATIGPTPAVTDNGDRLATTAWVNNFFALGIPLASGKIFIGSAGGIATAQSMSGDATLSPSGVITVTQSLGAFTVNGLLTVTGNASIGGSIIDANGILATNIVAPATPAAGTTRIYVDSTTKVLTFKNDAGTVGNEVVPSTCSTNQFGRSISSAGVFGCAQPAFTNISGSLDLSTQTTGNLAVSHLNSGTGASSSTFWRGDGTWATGGGTPGGSTTQLQYNNAGVFGGITGATTNGTTLTLVAPILGTPASVTLTNATGLPIATGLSDVAWTSYTPTVTASGTPTTVSATGRYKQIGKTVIVQAEVTVTAVGTATGSMIITLPITASTAANYVGSCFESGVSGKSGAGVVQTSQPTKLFTTDATGTTWWANGKVVDCTAVYEMP